MCKLHDNNFVGDTETYDGGGQRDAERHHAAEGVAKGAQAHEVQRCL